MGATKKNVAVASLTLGAGLLTAVLLLGGNDGEVRAARRADPAKKAQTLVTKLAAAESDLEAKTTKKTFAREIAHEAGVAREAGKLVASRRAAEVSREVIEALADAGTDEALESLARIAGSIEVSTALRKAALEALSELPKARALAQLRDFAFSNEPELASAAFEGIARLLKNPELPERARQEALNDLEGAATGGETERSCEALLVLSTVGAERSRRVFLTLASSQDDDVRADAVHGLRAYTGDDADSAVVKALSDSSATVRAAAVLAARGRSSAVDAVRALLERDQDETVRAEAVRFFAARAGDAEARAAVQFATRDPSAAVRSLALAVLGG